MLRWIWILVRQAQRTVSADERAPGSRGLVLHVLSMHTSPLAQPGDGDAGGMNVYVRQLSRAMVGEGAAVHVVTRSDTGEAWEARDEGVAVAGLPVGPPDAAKEDLPALVPDFARAVAQPPAAGRVARVVGGQQWRELMPLTREVTVGLSSQGIVEGRQGGRLIDLQDAVGPVRLAAGPRFERGPD